MEEQSSGSAEAPGLEVPLHRVDDYSAKLGLSPRRDSASEGSVSGDSVSSLSGSLYGSSSSSGGGSGLLLRIDASDPLLSSSPDWISQPRAIQPPVQTAIVSEPTVRQLGFTPAHSAAATAALEGHSSGAGGVLEGSGEAHSPLAPRHPLGLRESTEVLQADEAVVATNLDSRTFFQPLLVGDAQQRARALEKAVALLAESAEADAQHLLVRAHVSTVVRLSIECPFPDVRAAFADLLDRCSGRDIGVTIPEQLEGFSHFVDASNSSLPSLLETSDDPALVAKLCRMAFLQRGRASHLVQLLAWHPSYLELFYHLFDFLMHGPGPLPLPWRSYICIMAASRSQCKYLVEMQEKEFPDLGGDPRWLEGLSFAPQKIQNLATINAILAHQPWRLRSDHISELVRGASAWSMSELVQALVLLSSMHALAGLVHGCGITPEVEVEQLWCVPVEKGRTAQSRSEPDTTRSLYAVLAAQHEDEDEGSEDDKPQEDVFEIIGLDTAESGRISPSLSPQQGNARDSSSSSDDGATAANPGATNDGSSVSDSGESTGQSARDGGQYSKYWGGVELAHEDFDVKSHEYRIFHASDYSWKEEAFALVSQYYTDAAPLLDELFCHIYALTYRTFSSNEDVNTEPLRVAVRQYVHRVQGIFHDDYNYQKVNRFLTRTVKTFIKKVACSPERVTADDFRCIGIDLTDQEKCHLTLLIVEAKKQAELIYGLHAISRYLAGG